MIEVINAITDSLLRLSQGSAGLIPLLLVIAVIMALTVIGLMVWKGW